MKTRLKKSPTSKNNWNKRRRSNVISVCSSFLSFAIQPLVICSRTDFYVTDILKKQASQNNAEYDRLATELNAVTGQDKSNKRVDWFVSWLIWRGRIELSSFFLFISWLESMVLYYFNNNEAYMFDIFHSIYAKCGHEMVQQKSNICSNS